MNAAGVFAPSLRRQLLRPLLWLWLFGMGAAVAGSFFLARQSAILAFDRGLQDEAAALAARVTWSDRGPLLDVSRQTMELLSWDSVDRNSFVLVDLDGNTIAGDAAVPLPAQAVRLRSFEQPLTFDATYRDEAVRGAVFSVTSPMIDRVVSVIVVETTNKRAGVVQRILAGVLLPTLALGTVTFALLAFTIRRGLQPLRDLGQQVAERDVHDWRALPLAQVPREVVPLVERINRLLHDVQQAMALQRRFVADAAHQLRTPVAGIRVLAQELEQELAALPALAGAEAPLQMLTELRGSSDRLARLISQLLSLARSEAALSMDAEQASQDVVPLLREATEPLVLAGLRSGRVVELDAPDAPVVARAHPVWLGEVVNNLLDNAQRYGGHHIVLRVTPLGGAMGGGADVQVEDDGPGVAADQLERVFEPFWRGDRADVRNDGGTGLGLAIAREIVERLGGTLSVRSRPEFEGMQFTVRLAP